MRSKRMVRGPWVAIAASVLTVASIAGAMAGDDPAALLAQTDGMSIGEAGLELITSFEGCQLTGYLLGDGVCTIGYGHIRPELAGCTDWHITQEQAEEFLAQDVAEYADDVNRYFTRSFNQNQFDALVAFTYNVGQAYVKYDWPKDAPDSYFPGVMILYTNPPQFKNGLTRRREAEIALFETPVTEPEPTETADNVPTINRMLGQEEPLVLAPTSPASTLEPSERGNSGSQSPAASSSATVPGSEGNSSEGNGNEGTSTGDSGEVGIAPQRLSISASGGFEGGIGAR